MTESMTDDGGRISRHPNLNLITCNRLLMAETRDLKTGPQLIIRFPVSPCLQVYPAANRQYLAKVRIAYPCPYPNPYP